MEEGTQEEMAKIRKEEEEEEEEESGGGGRRRRKTLMMMAFPRLREFWENV